MRSDYLELEAKASSQTSSVQEAPVTFKINDPNSGDPAVDVGMMSLGYKDTGCLIRILVMVYCNPHIAV